MLFRVDIVQVLLVRHGATDWNLQGRCQGATDLDLNEVGVRQAKQIVASLTNEPIHGIYSSNLKRAQQTAQFFSLRHRLPVLIENDVRELDHGELEGRSEERRVGKECRYQRAQSHYR